MTPSILAAEERLRDAIDDLRRELAAAGSVADAFLVYRAAGPHERALADLTTAALTKADDILIGRVRL